MARIIGCFLSSVEEGFFLKVMTQDGVILYIEPGPSDEKIPIIGETLEMTIRDLRVLSHISIRRGQYQESGITL